MRLPPVPDLSWLPPLELLSQHGGDWPAYCERLYFLFRQDFLGVLPKFCGRRLALKYHPEYDGKCATFWHFISEGPNEEDRPPDLRRCERICWPRRMLDESNATSPRVLVWANERQNGTGWVIALEDFSYKFVLVERGQKVLPWTAYPVEKPHQRRAMQKEYEAWIASRKS